MRERLSREDGTPMGGPGAAPKQPMPEQVFVRCRCGERTAVDPFAALDAWWMDERARAYIRSRRDSVFGAPTREQASWDIECAACSAPMRLLFGVSEWGKMNTYYPDFFEVIELDG